MDSKEIENIVAEMKAVAGELRGVPEQYKQVQAKIKELEAQAAEITSLKDIVAALGLDEGEAGPICDDEQAPGLLPA